MQIIIAIGSFITVALLILGLTMKTERQIIRDRMNRQDTNGNQSPCSIANELGLSFNERVILPFLGRVAQFVGRFSPSSSIQGTEDKLIQAGRPYGMGSKEFLGLRVISVVGVIALGLFAIKFVPVAQMKLITMCFAVFIGGALPSNLIEKAIAARQNTIRKVLPEMLDLLTVSVEAGLGLDGAMQKVVEKMSNPLADEMNRALQEMRIGKLRVEALRDMALRTNVSELTSFIAALCQVEQLGGSISRVLRVQSTAIRQRRMQRARETAAKLPVKMLFPMVLFIFPSIFVVVLAPGALQIMRSMAGK